MAEYLFGLHAVQSLLHQAPERLLEMWLLRDNRNPRLQSLRAEAEGHGLRIQPASRDTLDKLAHHGNHQGVVIRCRAAKVRQDLEAWLAHLPANPLLLVLDGVQDPHNLGACLRTAEAAGVQAVIIPKDRAAGLSPTVHKVAGGAAERVPLFQVTNLARALKQLQDAGIWLTGTAGDAPHTLFEADLSGPLAVVMGAEGSGLRRLTRESCDRLVRIPMQGEAESLNVSVATGVCLFEALRQRYRFPEKPPEI